MKPEIRTLRLTPAQREEAEVQVATGTGRRGRPEEAPAAPAEGARSPESFWPPSSRSTSSLSRSRRPLSAPLVM